MSAQQRLSSEIEITSNVAIAISIVGAGAFQFIDSGSSVILALFLVWAAVACFSTVGRVSSHPLPAFIFFLVLELSILAISVVSGDRSALLGLLSVPLLTLFLHRKAREYSVKGMMLASLLFCGGYTLCLGEWLVIDSVRCEQDSLTSSGAATSNGGSSSSSSSSNSQFCYSRINLLLYVIATAAILVKVFLYQKEENDAGGTNAFYGGRNSNSNNNNNNNNNNIESSINSNSPRHLIDDDSGSEEKVTVRVRRSTHGSSNTSNEMTVGGSKALLSSSDLVAFQGLIEQESTLLSEISSCDASTDIIEVRSLTHDSDHGGSLPGTPRGTTPRDSSTGARHPQSRRSLLQQQQQQQAAAVGGGASGGGAGTAPLVPVSHRSIALLVATVRTASGKRFPKGNMIDALNSICFALMRSSGKTASPPATRHYDGVPPATRLVTSSPLATASNTSNTSTSTTASTATTGTTTTASSAATFGGAVLIPTVDDTVALVWGAADYAADPCYSAVTFAARLVAEVEKVNGNARCAVGISYSRTETGSFVFSSTHSSPRAQHNPRRNRERRTFRLVGDAFSASQSLMQIAVAHQLFGHPVTDEAVSTRCHQTHYARPIVDYRSLCFVQDDTFSLGGGGGGGNHDQRQHPSASSMTSLKQQHQRSSLTSPTKPNNAAAAATTQQPRSPLLMSPPLFTAFTSSSSSPTCSSLGTVYQIMGVFDSQEHFEAGDEWQQGVQKKNEAMNAQLRQYLEAFEASVDAMVLATTTSTSCQGVVETTQHQQQQSLGGKGKPKVALFNARALVERYMAAFPGDNAASLLLCALDDVIETVSAEPASSFVPSPTSATPASSSSTATVGATSAGGIGTSASHSRGAAIGKMFL